ncbi:CST complex subunit STN1 [Triticum urartu]|uniref:CST complex subunit STN1 n=1 Tax=Triticum urartu TaxID=4572 RepID=M7ZJA2_TRIUA|nr:CST complex subunit STN1 [Triticum urartu]
MQPRPAQDAVFWLLLPAQRRPAALNPTANGAARGRPERILAGYPAPPPGTVFRNSIPSGAHSSGPRPQDRVGRSAEPVNPQSSGLRLSTSSRPLSMDSLHLVHVKLLAADLLTLTPRHTSPASFVRCGRTVARAEVVGIVVSRDRREKFLRFLVDDGTGCIPCVLWLNHRYLNANSSSDSDPTGEMALKMSEVVRLGTLLRVRGRIVMYRGAIQIAARDVVLEEDPNVEVLHWLHYSLKAYMVKLNSKHASLADDMIYPAVICLRNMQWKASFLLSLMSIALEYCSWKLHGVYGGKGWQKILWIHLFQGAARMKKFCVAFMSGSCVFRMTRMRDHPCQRF